MMRRGRSWQTMILLAALTPAGSATRPASADVIAVENRPMAVGVSILELQKGRLFYELSSARRVDRPIDQVYYMQITGWDEFNRAEKFRQAGNWRAAAAAYEKRYSIARIDSNGTQKIVIDNDDIRLSGIIRRQIAPLNQAAFRHILQRPLFNSRETQQ